MDLTSILLRFFICLIYLLNLLFSILQGLFVFYLLQMPHPFTFFPLGDIFSVPKTSEF